MRPTDKAALKLNIVVTAGGGAGYSVTLTGLDKDGSAQSETINLTGAGTFVTTGWYSAVNSGGVAVSVPTDGSVTFSITQSQWGVVWKQGASQYQLDCFLYISDGTNESYFCDNDKTVTVTVTNLAGGSYVLAPRSHGHMKFGLLVDATAKTTQKGCTFKTIGNSSGYIRFIYTAGGEMFLYGCTVQTTNTQETQVYCGRIYNCDFNCTNLLLLPTSNGDYFSIRLFSTQGLCARINGTLTFQNITAYDSLQAVQVYAGVSDCTITNLVLRNCTYVLTALYPSAGSKISLINPDVDRWTFNWGGYPLTAYRKYAMDLTVTDKDNNPLSEATVTLKDKTDAQIFSVTTDANGNIVQQTVSRGYYYKDTGNTLQDSSPHILTIQKSGYQNYTKKFIITEKTKWEIKLTKAQPILLDCGKAVINLKPSNPENTLVLSI